MSIQMFDEEIIEKKKSTKVNLTCGSCGTSHIDDFWHKRCVGCRRDNKPITKKLIQEKKVFSGRTYSAGKTGENYPSVTSIIHPEGINFPPHLLTQYAARGTIVHKLIEEYHKSEGKLWLDPHNDPELKDKVKIVEEGSLKLKWEDCDYIGFRKEFHKDIKMNAFEQPIINHEHKFGGRFDANGWYKGDMAIYDFKTASAYTDDKLNDYFMQLSAYAKSLPDEYKYLVVIPLNPKKGYEAPYVSSDIEKHFQDFLVKRSEFEKIYGI